MQISAHHVNALTGMGVCMQTVWKYNREASLLRIMFLANSPRSGSSHTVLVTDIPGLEYGTFRVVLRRVRAFKLSSIVPPQDSSMSQAFLLTYF